jgi:hypothetical protein
MQSRRSLDSDSEEGDGNDTAEGDGDDSPGSKSPNSGGGLSKGKKKRIRRTASEIERAWKCTLCVKSYGSEGALKTHLKIKHPGAKLIKQAPPTTQQAFNKFYNMSQVRLRLFSALTESKLTCIFVSDIHTIDYPDIYCIRRSISALVSN